MVREGYKQTEVGEIPQDWNVFTLEEIADRNAPIRYGIVQIGPNVDNGVPIVPIKYIDKIDSSDLHLASSEVEQKYSKSRIKEKDLLISIKGTIGRVGIVPAGFEGNIAREIARVRVAEGINPEYVAYQLQASSTQERIVKAVVGTTRQEFSIASVRSFAIPVPKSETEQKVIADTLKDIDSLISTLENTISKKEAIKQSILQQYLTGKKRLVGFGDDKATKLTELGEIPADWDVVNVKSVVERYFCGPSPTCEERNIDETSDEWGVLRTTCSTIQNGWDWKKHKLLPKAYWGKKNIELEIGDVIITKAGPRHRVGIAVTIDYIPKKIVPSGKMIALRPNQSKVDSRLLSMTLMLKGSQDFLNQRTTGMAESQLNYENQDLLDAPIILQPLPEQKKLADYVADFQMEIDSTLFELEKLKCLKEGMMQELLTGRTRLVGVPVSGEAKEERMHGT